MGKRGGRRRRRMRRMMMMTMTMMMMMMMMMNDILVCNLDVNVHVRRGGTLDVHGDVNDEWHASLIAARGGCNRKGLLSQLHVRIAIAVHSQASVGVNVQGVLGRVLLLASHSITNAVAGVATVWECDGRGSHCNRLAGAVDILVCNLDVNVHVRRGGTLDVHGDVNDEWHASLIAAGGGCNRKGLLSQLHVRIAIAVESQASVRVDIQGVLGRVLLLA